MPVLYEVRDITLAKDGNFALVSYEYKVSSIRLELHDDNSSHIILVGTATTLEAGPSEGSNRRRDHDVSTFTGTHIYA